MHSSYYIQKSAWIFYLKIKKKIPLFQGYIFMGSQLLNVRKLVLLTSKIYPLWHISQFSSYLAFKCHLFIIQCEYILKRNRYFNDILWVICYMKRHAINWACCVYLCLANHLKVGRGLNFSNFNLSNKHKQRTDEINTVWLVDKTHQL